VGLSKSCGGVRIGFVSFCGVSLLIYIRMLQPKGSALKGRDDVMAVMIRFLAIDETCPGPGNRNVI
jgi:hypothetical protein